ncbi:MAG: T9SS type A sorting domain-containing protein, partial [Ferruginibacter sp.]
GTGTGTLKFSGTNTFSGNLWSVAAYSIPFTMGLWINNPNFTVNGQNGSPSVAGSLRVTAGTYNVGTSSGNSMGFQTGSNIIVEGGNINTTGRFGVSSAGNAFSYNQSGGNVTVCTVGNASTTLASFDLGTNLSSSISLSAGTIIVQSAGTGASGPKDYRNQAGNGIVGVMGGTLQLGNASSGAAKTFTIVGVIPNLILSNTSANHTTNLNAVLVNFNNASLNITINTGTTLNLGNLVFEFDGTTLTNNGTLTHNGPVSNFLWNLSTAPQSYTGSGIVTAPMTNFSILSAFGLTLNAASPNITVTTLRLINGNVTNANKITVGNGGASTGIIQIGNATNATTAGGFDVPPTFNAGTGGIALLYLRTITVARTTGNEIPPSRILSSLIVDDNDLTHSLILDADLAVSSGTAPSFAFTNGSIDLGGNVLTLGFNSTSSALAGTMTTGAAANMFNGEYKRWISATTGSRDFPMGTDTDKKDASINFTTAPATGGTLIARWSAVPPSFPNAVSITEGTLNVNAVSIQGSWFIDAADGLTGGLYTGTFTANGSTDVVDYTKTVLIKRPSSGGNWTLDGTHIISTGSNTAPVLSRTGMSGFSEFAVGGELFSVLPISIEYIKGSKLASGNLVNWKISCTNSPSAVMTLERSANGRNFTDIKVKSATAIECRQPFSYLDAAILAGINYYRLKITDPDGHSYYSSIIALLNKDQALEFISMVPNPVSTVATLNVTSGTNTKMEIKIINISGKQVGKQTISLSSGNNLVPLNFANLSPGVYEVVSYTADGQVKTLGFVKQ